MYHRVMLIGYIIATLKDSSVTLIAYMHTNSSFIGKFHRLCSSGFIGRFIALGSSAVHRVIKITKTDKVRELHISWLTVKANISFRSLWQSASPLWPSSSRARQGSMKTSSLLEDGGHRRRPEDARQFYGGGACFHTQQEHN
jgi:hypothetical protein